MSDIHEARIEAACEAYKNPRRMVTNTSDGRHRDCMEAALEAADAVVTVEQIAEVVRDADVRWNIAESSDGPFDPRTHSEAIAEAIQRLYRGEAEQ